METSIPVKNQDTPQSSLKYAGFWRRAIADCLDSLILDSCTFLIILMGLGILYWIRRIHQPQVAYFDPLNTLTAQVILFGIRSLLALGYYTWTTYAFGTTLGKYPLKIQVIQISNGQSLTLQQSLLRCIAYTLSYLPFGAGFLMAALHPEKRALHDLVAGSLSVLKPHTSTEVTP
jgi:uncharacterized RDD family membrane protein YckC